MRYRVKNENVTVLSDETLVAGSVERYLATFDFDESWDGYAKTVRFRRGTVVDEILASLTGMERSITCEIPWEVLSDAGVLQIGVHGEMEDKTNKTAYAPFKMIYGGAKGKSAADAPTPDVWQQLLAAIGDITPYVGENGHWFVGDVDTGKPAQGEKGETGPQGKQGAQGERGEKGEPGADGKDGADGYTPIRGTDYYTEADKAEMVEAVLAALPNGDEVSY